MTMKNLLIFILTLVPLFLFSQNQVTLDDCKEKARENFPKIQQAELLTEISRLKTENLKSNYLPSVDLKGQATYQSEVTSIDLPDAIVAMGFNLDGVSKDQYKVYLDVKQNIWDGGITKQMKEAELAALNTNLQKIEVEVKQLYDMVEQYYFTVLKFDKSIETLQAQSHIFDKQIKLMNSAFENGAAREKDKIKLELEQLSLQQSIDNLLAQKKGVLAILSILTGENYGDETQFELPSNKMESGSRLTAQEQYIDFQQQQLSSADNILTASRNPKFFGFGQTGYGKPGLNMLKNEFRPYYIVGVGVNWSVFDWKETKRNKEINSQQREIISTFKSDFTQKQKMQKVQVLAQIEGLKKQIELDDKILEGREKVAETAASELNAGSITSTDYLVDLNAQMVAKISHEMHKIQLIQATYKYNSIMGY